MGGLSSVAKVGEKAAERVIGKVGAKAGVKSGEKAAKEAAESVGAKGTTGAKEAAEQTTKEAAAKKRSLIRRHPKIAAGVLGAGGLMAAGHLTGDGGGPRQGSDYLDGTEDPRTATGRSHPNTNGGNGEGEVEFDTEVIRAFAENLRQAADHVEDAPKTMATAVDALTKHYLEDGAGNRTQDGKAVPLSADMLDAMSMAQDEYSLLVSAILTQLRGDAERLEKYCEAQENTQRDAKRQFENIDTTLV